MKVLNNSDVHQSIEFCGIRKTSIQMYDQVYICGKGGGRLMFCAAFFYDAFNFHLFQK